jgi:hypothetical protein
VAYDLLDVITKHVVGPLRLYRFREEHHRNAASELRCGACSIRKRTTLFPGPRHIRVRGSDLRYPKLV